MKKKNSRGRKKMKGGETGRNKREREREREQRERRRETVTWAVRIDLAVLRACRRLGS